MFVRIHFLDVGDGDCTLVEFPSGRTGMVDVNYAGQWTDPIEYYKRRIGQDKELFRFVVTHPHRDHLTKIAELHSEIGLTNFWDTNHDFEPEEIDKDYEEDWATYCRIRSRQYGEWPRVLKFHRGDENKDFLNEDGIYVLSPSKEQDEEARASADPQAVHDMGYVLMLSYGKSKVVLGGDASYECWSDIWLNHTNEFLKAQVLKASHHGRKTGYHEQAVRAIDPDYVIISVGIGATKNDLIDYGQETNATVFSTAKNGDIVVTCDSYGTIEVTPSYGV